MRRIFTSCFIVKIIVLCVIERFVQVDTGQIKTTPTAVCKNGTGQEDCCYSFKRNKRGDCVPCPPGSFGNNCSSPCPQGHYGQFCSFQCNCKANHVCLPDIGCFCTDCTTVQKDTSHSFNYIILISVVVAMSLFITFGVSIRAWTRRKRRTRSAETANVGQQLLFQSPSLSNRPSLREDSEVSTPSGSGTSEFDDQDDCLVEQQVPRVRTSTEIRKSLLMHQLKDKLLTSPNEDDPEGMYQEIDPSYGNVANKDECPELRIRKSEVESLNPPPRLSYFQKVLVGKRRWVKSPGNEQRKPSNLYAISEVQRVSESTPNQTESDSASCAGEEGHSGAGFFRTYSLAGTLE